MSSFSPSSAPLFALDPNIILSQTPPRATRRQHSPSAPPPPTPRSAPSLDLSAADQADRYTRLCEFLEPADRQLIRALYADGHSPLEVCTLLNQPRESLRRRVDRLTRRMAAPEFTLVALRRAAWPPSLRAVATACVLEGKSLRAAARQLGLSIYAVRTLRDNVLAMTRGVQESDALQRRWR